MYKILFNYYWWVDLNFRIEARYFFCTFLLLYLNLSLGCAASSYGWNSEQFTTKGWIKVSDSDATYQRIKYEISQSETIKKLTTDKGMPDYYLTTKVSQVNYGYLKNRKVYSLHTIYGKQNFQEKDFHDFNYELPKELQTAKKASENVFEKSTQEITEELYATEAMKACGFSLHPNPGVARGELAKALKRRELVRNAIISLGYVSTEHLHKNGSHLKAELKELDANIPYLHAKQGYNDISFTGDPRYLQTVLSEDSGYKIRFQPRVDCLWDLGILDSDNNFHVKQSAMNNDDILSYIREKFYKPEKSDVDTDWRWDKFREPNSYENIWACRGTVTGQFADNYKCAGQYQSDETWPNN